MGKFSDRYKTDHSLEENGVEIDMGEGISFTIRSITSEKSKEVRRKLEKPYARMIRSNSLPDSVQEEITKKQLAYGVLIGWKGVEDPDGNLLEFSPENALKVFGWYKHFLGDVITAVTERETFKSEDREAAVKN